MEHIRGEELLERHRTKMVILYHILYLTVKTLMKSILALKVERSSELTKTGTTETTSFDGYTSPGTPFFEFHGRLSSDPSSTRGGGLFVVT